MRGALGLIIYVVVAIISGIIKKMAKENAKTGKVRIDTTFGESYTVTLDDMVKAEDLLPSTLMSSETEYEDYVYDDDHKEEAEGDLDDFALRRLQESKSVPLVSEVGVMPKQINLGQAILMSEIVRAPRAKRPWPSR